jgi:hypothetical protein
MVYGFLRVPSRTLRLKNAAFEKIACKWFAGSSPIED